MWLVGWEGSSICMGGGQVGSSFCVAGGVGRIIYLHGWWTELDHLFASVVGLVGSSICVAGGMHRIIYLCMACGNDNVISHAQYSPLKLSPNVSPWGPESRQSASYSYYICSLGTERQIWHRPLQQTNLGKYITG